MLNTVFCIVNKSTKFIYIYINIIYIYIYIYIYILGMANNKVKVLNVRSIIEYNKCFTL